MLLSFTVDPALGIGRIHQAAARVQAEVDDDAEILFGVCVDPTLSDEVHVSIVAAGLPDEAPRAAEREASAEVEVEVAVAAPARARNALVMLR